MSMRFTEIGQQLRAYRLESGLRAEEIAARLGVSRAALYRYEKGEVIKLDTIKRLAELLKISPLSLLGIGVEYYNRPIGYFERHPAGRGDGRPDPAGLRADLLPDHVRRLRGRARRGVRRGGRPGRPRNARRCARMAEQVLGMLAARKRMYAMRRPGIIAMVSLSRSSGCWRRRGAGMHVSDRVRRICRDVAVDRGGEYRRADGSRADGAAVRAADRGRADVGVQDPAHPRPGEPGDQPFRADGNPSAQTASR